MSPRLTPGRMWKAGGVTDYSRFYVQHDCAEHAFAAGPAGKPGRYAGLTVCCYACIDEDDGCYMPVRAVDPDADCPDLSVLIGMADTHWAERHAGG